MTRSLLSCGSLVRVQPGLPSNPAKSTTSVDPPSEHSRIEHQPGGVFLHRNYTSYPPVRFTVDDANRAADEWGCNCGPGAVAGILGLTLDEIRPHLGDFEQKHYTNPTLMWAILRSLGVKWKSRRLDVFPCPESWPEYGLARVQWEGPWTDPGVPMAARYRHTHWVGARWDGSTTQVFDINALCVGGWIPVEEWSGDLVPWLLNQVEPKANGRWHLTHSVEVRRA